MSHKVIKILILGAMVVSALASASSASATAWTTNGPLNYTATAPAAKVTIASPSNPVVICTTVSVTGNIVATGGNTGSSFDVGGVLPKFSSCTIAGLAGTVTCSNTARFIVIPPTSQPQQGHLTNISCIIQRGVCAMTLTGEATVQYTNATNILRLFKAGQNLVLSAPAACSAITGAPSGGVWPATWFNNATNGDLDFTVTSTPKPNIL